MMVTKTPGGADFIEMTPEEYADYVERRVQAAVGMAPEEFRRAYLARELDDADPSVSELVGLLRIGQNGHA
jgi:hypothetical protein